MNTEYCYCPIKIPHSHMTDKSCVCEEGRELVSREELDIKLNEIIGDYDYNEKQEERIRILTS